jgi:hypothetical protein
MNKIPTRPNSKAICIGTLGFFAGEQGIPVVFSTQFEGGLLNASGIVTIIVTILTQEFTR